MASKKPAKKAKAKAKAKPRMKGDKPAARGSIGDNSENIFDNDEVRKIASAQRALDKEIESTKKDWTERKRNLTTRLEKVGVTREQFKDPYELFKEIAECKNDTEVKKVLENTTVHLAKTRKVYDALTPNKQLDWLDLVQDAEKIESLRAAAEREAAEDAAENAEEPEETPAAT